MPRRGDGSGSKGAEEDKSHTYAAAGVNVEAARKAVDAIRQRVRGTLRSEVVSDIGHFGGMFAFDPKRYRDPILVSGMDGAGTKVMVAEKMGVYDTIGIDLVAMSVNDVAALGAEPLFFLDYILMGKLEPNVVDEIIKGIVEGCRQANCALIGGEIAEHPGHLEPGSFDLAGTCVGVVERDEIVDGSRIEAGDVVIGLASSGLHSNGFSLVRKVLLEEMGMKLDDRPLGLESTLGEELLRPTLIYAPVMLGLRREVDVKGFAHVTQGGIEENLGRIIPPGLGASVKRGAWEPHPIFGLIKSLGRVDEKEMYSTFNMGLGMLVVVGAASANPAFDYLRSQAHRAYEVGVVEEA
jgi:phosphoribosylformylglycinamidine cyclo-ligase